MAGGGVYCMHELLKISENKEEPIMLIPHKYLKEYVRKKKILANQNGVLINLE